MNKRPRNIVLSLVAVVFVFSVSTLIYTTISRTPRYNNIDEVRTSSGLMVVLPTSLPLGSEITYHPTFDSATNIVSTVITVDNIGVTFSQQKRPETDLKQIDAADTFLVEAGSVYIINGEKGRLQAIVETEDSWVLVNADARIGSETLKTLISALDTIE